MSDEAKYPTSPCANCPYRKDAPRKLWHRTEFENLLDQNHDQFNGHTFGCHKHIELPIEKRGWCAGWALNQQARGVPSIRLRLLLMSNKTALAAWKKLSAKGLKLFSTIEEMCRANGVYKKSAASKEAEEVLRQRDAITESLTRRAKERASKPLNGEKTHPLTEAALTALRRIAGGPLPRQEFNPGVVNRLEREQLVECYEDASPYRTVKKKVRFLRITDAGVKRLKRIGRLPVTNEIDEATREGR